MEDKFVDRFRIKSGRLNNWDYSKPGMYFVTICTLNMNLFLGKIVDNNMKYSTKGKIVFKNLINMPIKFSQIKMVDYVIMPNHVHILMEITENKCGREMVLGCRDVINHVSTKENEKIMEMQKKCPMNIVGLGTVIRWFKAKSSREIRKENLFFGWQSRYYDQIIFNKDELLAVKIYIKNNPKNWDKDKFYKNK